MRTKIGNYRWKPLQLFILLFLCQIMSCGEQKQPIGIITTTSYCTGRITSSSKIVKPGDIALSHDIIKKYRLKFGDLIYLDGEDVPYVFLDKMPPQWHGRADLYSRICKHSEDYGVRKRMIWFVRKNKGPEASPNIASTTPNPYITGP